jgi:hypothetical protein
MVKKRYDLMASDVFVFAFNDHFQGFPGFNDIQCFIVGPCFNENFNVPMRSNVSLSFNVSLRSNVLLSTNVALGPNVPIF